MPLSLVPCNYSIISYIFINGCLDVVKIRAIRSRMPLRRHPIQQHTLFIPPHLRMRRRRHHTSRPLLDHRLRHHPRRRLLRHPDLHRRTPKQNQPSKKPHPCTRTINSNFKHAHQHTVPHRNLPRNTDRAPILSGVPHPSRFCEGWGAVALAVALLAVALAVALAVVVAPPLLLPLLCHCRCSCRCRCSAVVLLLPLPLSLLAVVVALALAVVVAPPLLLPLG